MQIEIIDSYDEFAALENSWKSLYLEDPEAQFFLSWTWFSKVFHDRPDEWRIIVVKPEAPNANNVGFFPIRVTAEWSRRDKRFRNEILMAGSLNWGQYCGFVCHPHWEEPVIVCFAEQLKTMHWASLVLEYFHASDRRMKLFLSQFDNDLFRISYQEQTINNGNVNLLISPYVELPNDYESYLNTLSANTRQKIRRYTRQFEKSEDLHITTTSRNTLQRDLDLLVELWSTKWREYRGAKTNRYARKYRRIVEHGFDCGTVYMPILWRGETPLGIMASFVDWAKPCMYFFVSGRNVSDRSAYTGWLLHTHNIKWAIENGMKKYDLLHGNEPYKYSYGCKDHHIKCPIVKTRSRVNLNGMLDPGSIDDVEADLRRFLKKERLGQAKTGFEQILEVHTALGNEKSMAAHYTNLGIIHQREADHAEAEKLYRKAVDLYQPLDCKEELARLYSRLGSIHISQEHLDQSRESYLKALELYKTLGSTESLANVYGNLGNIQRHLGDLDEADDYYRKSLNGYEELGNKEGMARVFANLGNLHKTKNEPEKAKADWATALTLCEEAGLESEAADLRERIADLAV